MGSYKNIHIYGAYGTPDKTTQERRRSEGLWHFLYIFTMIFSLIFVFFGSSIRSLINILNIQPVEETDRKTRAQMAQEKSRAGN